MKRISKREKEFCINYAEVGILAAAVKLAGYSPTGASAQGTRLMARPRVRKYYEQLLEEKFNNGTMITKSAIRSKLISIINNPKATIDQQLKGLDQLSKLGQFYKDPLAKMAGLSSEEVKEVIQRVSSGQRLLHEG